MTTTITSELKPQVKAIEFEAFYLYENNKLEFDRLISQGYFQNQNSTQFIENLKAKFKADSESELLKTKIKPKNNRDSEGEVIVKRPKHFVVIDTHDQDAEPEEPSYLAMALWASLVPSNYKALYMSMIPSMLRRATLKR